MKMTMFVDKSLMIRDLLSQPLGQISYITAPYDYGKSTNLEMVKMFLEIEVDKYGETLFEDAITPEKPVVNTPNYKAFVKRNLNILKCKKVMNDHFGKYPIIHLNFGGPGIYNNMACYMYIFKLKIHEAYMQHKYLMKSGAILKEQRDICKQWCNTKKLHDLYEKNVTDALYNLSLFLFMHYGRDVYILIDEYSFSLINVYQGKRKKPYKRKDYPRFIDLKRRILKSIFDKNPFVHGGLVTGSSPIGQAGIIETFKKVKRFRFLENHEFVEYYGFTEKEVSKLFADPQYGLNKHLIKDAYKIYDGYTSLNNIKIFSTYSITRFLYNTKVESYWKKHTGEVPFMGGCFKIKKFRRLTEDYLMKNKSITITVNDTITLDDFLNVWEILDSPSKHKKDVNIDIFLMYLVDTGFLTYLPDKKYLRHINRKKKIHIYKRKLKIPNREVKGHYKANLLLYHKHYNYSHFFYTALPYRAINSRASVEQN